MSSRVMPAATLLAATLLLAACGSGAATPAPSAATPAPSVAASEAPPSEAPPSAAASAAPPSAAAASCEVTDGATGTAAEIKSFAYPAGLSVAEGSAITWTNADTAPHTVTIADGGCDSGQIAAGASTTITYTTPGTYTLSCLIHPSMRGSVEVR